MRYQQASEYLENQRWSSTKVGLGRTRQLLAMLGHPEEQLRFIHVTGSNGKGSCCAMLASVLEEAGLKTGLYTSPHLERLTERIRINGAEIGEDRLAALTERIRGFADGMADHPSQFELLTALALTYFFEERCDIVVLEVGMGGAWDSTNAIPAPELAVIMNIGLEHTEYLGSTIEAIAKTKAGIIKPGASCVLYDGDPRATAVIEEDCREKDVPLRMADFSQLTLLASSLDGQAFRYKHREYEIPLLGRHQLRNAAVVIECFKELLRRGWALPAESLYCGLLETKWPARFEVLREDPLFILDGGHNPQCAQALADCIRDVLPGRKITFLCGILRDKDYRAMIDAVLPLAESFVCLAPQNPRALPARELAAVIEEKGGKATPCDSISEGVRLAEQLAAPHGCVVAFGSLYLAGAVRRAVMGEGESGGGGRKVRRGK